MIRSLVFTTQGRLQSHGLELDKLPPALKDPNLFLWVDLEAATAEESKSVLADLFHFHPLSIEDCVMVGSSPKVEEYVPREDDKFAPYLFIVVHGVDYSRKDGVFATSELEFFLGKNFLVSYHHTQSRVVSLIEELALKNTTPLARAPDRLLHKLLATIVENYKPALDDLSDEIAGLERRALERPTRATLNRILQTKKEAFHLRRIIIPQRDVIARLARGEFNLIRPHLLPYYRDTYDALDHISQLAQGYTDSLTGTLQTYLNVSSNQTGEVVKLLTLITVITTPMMMVGTWYGMNFQNMPELKWKYGYPLALAVTLLATLATYLYFRKKKWF